MSTNNNPSFTPSFLSDSTPDHSSAPLDKDFWSPIMHPEDRQAIKALEALPALSSICKFIQEKGIETASRAQMIGDSIRLGPKQLPKIYALLEEVCDALQMKQIPDFYLQMDRSPNAFTVGEHKPLITITSGLYEIMPEEDIKTVLAHECGHILFKHTRYSLVAKLVFLGANSTIGQMANIAALGSLTALKQCIFRWERMSELSADRVSLLFAGNISTAIRVQLMLAGGLRNLPEEINIDEYIRQSDDFVQMFKPNNVTGLISNLTLMDLDHPYAASRCVEMSSFAKSSTFKVAAKHLGTLRCPQCGAKMRTASMCMNGHFC